MSPRPAVGSVVSWWPCRTSPGQQGVLEDASSPPPSFTQGGMVQWLLPLPAFPSSPALFPLPRHYPSKVLAWCTCPGSCISEAPTVNLDVHQGLSRGHNPRLHQTLTTFSSCHHPASKNHHQCIQASPPDPKVSGSPFIPGDIHDRLGPDGRQRVRGPGPIETPPLGQGQRQLWMPRLKAGRMAQGVIESMYVCM